MYHIKKNNFSLFIEESEDYIYSQIANILTLIIPEAENFTNKCLRLGINIECIRIEFTSENRNLSVSHAHLKLRPSQAQTHH